MSASCLYQVKVLSGRKAGAAHPLPLGDLSIGTTLEDEFFIGCVDMWHQLLRADSSANSRSATASVDALPEQRMQCVLTHTQSGITLRVKSGFAQIGENRLLPGDSAAIPINTELNIGASKLEVRPVTTVRDTTVSGNAHGNVHGHITAPKPTESRHHWLNNKVAFSGMTAAAVAGLSAAILFNPPKGNGGHGLNHEPPTTAPAVVFDEKVVAIVSTSPAFVITESGQRYGVGALVDDGYKIVGISGSNIELQKGTERLQMPF